MATLIAACARCRLVGPLQTHHTRLRSQGGHDSPKAYLCYQCHRLVHDHSVEDWEDWIQRTGEEPKQQGPDF